MSTHPELGRALSAWLELTPALVVNRLAAMASNSSKPYQGRQIRSFGFQVPDTLITTEPAAALEFWERHGPVIYKSISGVRSIVSRLTPTAVNRLKDVKSNPVQEYIPGTDIRVRRRDDGTPARLSTRRLSCTAAGGTVDFRSYDLRKNIWTMPQADGIWASMAGIDLRRTPDERWYCFEVNPSPGFTFFETHTGHPIGQSVAELLINRSVA
jgi:glutathione synthase/RimK-type ligase-like ATP-grasp enzyme